MSDWQSIETAPKDGQIVQLYALHCTVPTIQLARWKPENAPFIAGWWSSSSIYRHDMIQWKPTHWAPFVAPEVAGKEDQK